MQKLFVSIKECTTNMNKLSKYYIKYGNIIIFTLYTLALFCTICAGRIGNYDNIIFLRDELLVCSKEVLGAVYVPALFIEIAVLGEKSG